MQDINLKQICKILEENQIPSSHDGRHRATMDPCETSCYKGINRATIVCKVQAQKVHK
jgi:hypothetical protein